MYEQEILKSLKDLGKQVWNLQQLMLTLDRDFRSMRVVGNAVVKTMPFAVKDISSAQLIDAYKRGLNMEQLVALSGGKYSPEQIAKKLQRGGMA